MKNMAFATMRELIVAVEKKEVSKKELLSFFLERFKKYDQEIGAALEVFNDLQPVEKEGRLAGIPGIIKDNICQKDRITSCASKILANYHAPYDATAISRLKNAGGVMIGRANCDEFAMGSSTETSAFQKTKNPWDFDRVPGGSSGGSAAAVAAGLVPWALGSETGGSVRLPAAFCNVVGLKPTYGLVSRFGLIAYGSSLDQIGVCTRSVYDSALILSIIAGKDAADSSSLAQGPVDYTKSLDGKLPEGIRIGVVENALHAHGMDNEVVQSIQNAINHLQERGAQIKRINLHNLEYAAAVYFIISRAEAASNLARFDGIRYGMRAEDAKNLSSLYANTRHDGFGDEVKLRIIVGNYVLSAGHAADFYGSAQQLRQAIRAELMDAFKDVDLLVMPTHPAPAFRFGAFDVDKLQMDLQDYFTCPANLAGIPALNIPCGFSKDGLPIGFQFMAPPLGEELLFRVGDAYQQETDWHKKYPQAFV